MGKEDIIVDEVMSRLEKGEYSSSDNSASNFILAFINIAEHKFKYRWRGAGVDVEKLNYSEIGYHGVSIRGTGFDNRIRVEHDCVHIDEHARSNYGEDDCYYEILSIMTTPQMHKFHRGITSISGIDFIMDIINKALDDVRYAEYV